MYDNATINAHVLSAASVAFCNAQELEPTDELVRVLCQAVMTALAQWYKDNGKTFAPQTDLIEDEAILYAFEKMGNIAMLARISAMTGIGMEGFEE